MSRHDVFSPHSLTHFTPFLYLSLSISLLFFLSVAIFSLSLSHPLSHSLSSSTFSILRYVVHSVYLLLSQNSLSLSHIRFLSLHLPLLSLSLLSSPLLPHLS